MKKTILLVDDDLLMLQLVARMFPRNEFELLMVANGQAALKILDEHNQNIDLIITDYNMPNMNGLELANAVRIRPNHQDTPLILITANTEITSLLGKHYNVFNEIIHKPFSSEFILTKVAALLGK